MAFVVQLVSVDISPIVFLDVCINEIAIKSFCNPSLLTQFCGLKNAGFIGCLLFESDAYNYLEQFLRTVQLIRMLLCKILYTSAPANALLSSYVCVVEGGRSMYVCVVGGRMG